MSIQEKIEIAIPEIKTISDYQNKDFISIKNWNNRIKGVATKNLNRYKKALTSSSLIHYFKPCIICIHDGEMIEYNKEKYLLIRRYLMSEEFNS